MKLGTDANVAVAAGSAVRYTSVVSGTPTFCGFTERDALRAANAAAIFTDCGATAPDGSVVCRPAAIVDALPDVSGGSVKRSV